MKTIECPHCKKPFKQQGGKFFCECSGWHELNDSLELVPSSEPPAAEPNLQPPQEQEASGSAAVSPDAPGGESRLRIPPPVMVGGLILGVLAAIALWKRLQQQRTEVATDADDHAAQTRTNEKSRLDEVSFN